MQKIFRSSYQKPYLGTQLNLSHPLAQGLVGCWLMNEGAGNKAFDLSGNKNSGTFINSPVWAANGLSLIPNQYVNMGDISTLKVAKITLAVMLCSSVTGNYQDVAGNNYYDGNAGYKIAITPTGVMYFTVMKTSANGLTIPSNQWCLGVGTYDKINIKFYFNGLLIQSVPYTTTPAYDATQFKIGLSYSDFFNGKIAFVYVYDRALSAQEIAQLYVTPYCIFDEPEMPVWMMAAVTPPVSVSIPTAHLVLQSFPPLGGVSRVDIPVSSLILTPHAPTIWVKTPVIVSVPVSSLILIPHVPTIWVKTPVIVSVPVSSLILTPYAPTTRLTVSIPVSSLILTPYAPAGKFNIRVDIPAAAIILQPYNPSYIWLPSGAQLYTLQNIYLCVLTGAADGLDDVIIPISSFQSVLRDGYPSYLSCVIPNSIDYIVDIMARTHGDIVVKKGYKYSDGTINTEEICRVTYETLQIYRGGRNDFATISGHKTTTSTAPKNRALTDVSFYGLQVDGKRAFRAAPDLFLRVGDIATYGGESIVVGQISYIVDAWLAIMQITEA